MVTPGPVPTPSLINSADCLQPLRGLGPIIRFPPRAQLCVQGSTAHNVFFLESGLVVLTVTGEDGKQHCLGYRTKDWIVGAACVLSDQSFPASVTTKAPTAVRVIHGADFLRILQENTALSLHVHRMHA